MTAREYVDLYRGRKVKLWTRRNGRNRSITGIVMGVYEFDQSVRISVEGMIAGVCRFPNQLTLLDECEGDMRVGDRVRYIGSDYRLMGLSGPVISVLGGSVVVRLNEPKVMVLNVRDIQVITRKTEPLPLPG